MTQSQVPWVASCLSLTKRRNEVPWEARSRVCSKSRRQSVLTSLSTTRVCAIVLVTESVYKTPSVSRAFIPIIPYTSASRVRRPCRPRDHIAATTGATPSPRERRRASSSRQGQLASTTSPTTSWSWSSSAWALPWPCSAPRSPASAGATSSSRTPRS